MSRKSMNKLVVVNISADSIFQVQDQNAKLQDQDQAQDANVRDQDRDSSSIIAISGCPLINYRRKNIVILHTRLNQPWSKNPDYSGNCCLICRCSRYINMSGLGVKHNFTRSSAVAERQRVSYACLSRLAN